MVNGEARLRRRRFGWTTTRPSGTGRQRKVFRVSTRWRPVFGQPLPKVNILAPWNGHFALCARVRDGVWACCQLGEGWRLLSWLESESSNSGRAISEKSWSEGWGNAPGKPLTESKKKKAAGRPPILWLNLPVKRSLALGLSPILKKW